MLRRVGNLAAYEGDWGPEERLSGGMDESDGCWAAIVARRKEEENSLDAGKEVSNMATRAGSRWLAVACTGFQS
jgi:hypothetical protein